LVCEVVSTVSPWAEIGGVGPKEMLGKLFSVKLDVDESMAVIIPLSWLGSSCTLLVEKVHTGGGPQPPTGITLVVMQDIDPGSTATWRFWPKVRLSKLWKINPEGMVKPTESTE
jgi:hypothetical protein